MTRRKRKRRRKTGKKEQARGSWQFIRSPARLWALGVGAVFPGAAAKHRNEHSCSSPLSWVFLEAEARGREKNETGVSVFSIS